jgi:hypothetical protein
MLKTKAILSFALLFMYTPLFAPSVRADATSGRIAFRRVDTEAHLIAGTPLLGVGEPALAVNNGSVYIGTASGNRIVGTPQAGATGPAGAAGTNGTNGAAGATGAQGIQGATGTAGTNGTNGAAGTRGSLEYTGSGAPGVIAGVLASDLYLNTANGDVYTYTTSWGSPVINLKGPTGATGAAGPQGTAGTAGSTGAAGPTGATGAAGVGPTGTDAQTLRYNGTTLASTSSILNNGSQVAVGGSVDTSSRFSVNPQGASENGLSVTMPSGGTGIGIKSTGRAVITTAGAATSLTVTSTGAVNIPLVTLASVAGIGPSIGFVSNGGTNSGLFQLDQAGDMVFRSGSDEVGNAGITVGSQPMYFDAQPIFFRTANKVNRAYISSSGLFGIATTSPAAQLEVDPLSSGTIGQILKLQSGQTADADQLLTSASSILNHTTAAGIRYSQGYGIRSGASDINGLTVTIPLAKLTAGGTNGSETFTGGLLTAYAPPT